MVKFVIYSALKDRFFLSILGILILVFLGSNFFGSLLIAENEQASSAYFQGITRYIFIISAIIYPCIFISNLYESRQLEFFLSQQRSRNLFILKILSGLFICFAALYLISLIFHSNYSLIFETAIIISFALFTSLNLKSPFYAILLTATFYFLSRLSGLMVGLIEIKSDIITQIFSIISALLPRFDLFNNFHTDVIIQTAIYLILIISACILDFRRKEI